MSADRDRSAPRRRWGRGAVVALMITGLVAAPAAADDVRDEAARDGTVAVPMTYVDDEGRTTDRSGQPAPRDIVEGNCGFAFLFMFDTGSSAIEQEWGFFDLDILATAYTWNYVVTGPGGFTRSDSGGGTLFFRREWTGTDFYAVGAAGNYTGIASIEATNGAQTCTGSAPDSVFVN